MLRLEAEEQGAPGVMTRSEKKTVGVDLMDLTDHGHFQGEGRGSAQASDTCQPTRTATERPRLLPDSGHRPAVFFNFLK